MSSKRVAMIKMSEASIKRACEDYLQYHQNQGKLLFLRLNSGDLVVTNPDGKYRRRIKGCPKGTSDLLILKKDIDTMLRPRIKVMFFEIKSADGKQTPEQLRFQKVVELMGCSYKIIRSVEELQEIVP